jgi:hypothetical protein
VVFANAGGGDMLPLKAITADHVDLFSPLRMRAS